MTLHVSRSVYGRHGPSHTVLCGDEYFQVDQRQLARLEAGETPGELDLDPIEEEPEHD